MVEVCFNDSVRGALRAAQRCGGEDDAPIIALLTREGETVSQEEERWMVAEAEEQWRGKQAAALPLGGSPDDVLALSFMLSFGDIAAPITEGDRTRTAGIQALYSVWEQPREGVAGIERLWHRCCADQETLRRRAAQGEPVRIWCDGTPDAQCGLRYAASLLRDMDCPVTAVFLPPWRVKYDGVVAMETGWGEVEPEEFGQLLSEEWALPPPLLMALSVEWARLQKENAPLRAMVNGRLVSAGADFYDSFIRAKTPRGEFRLAELIGSVLGLQLGVGDRLVAWRVLTMVDRGELRIVRPNADWLYDTVLCAR